MAKRFSCRLRSVGNPDFGQHAPVSEPRVVDADTLPGIVAACRQYIEEWDLGGGNWTDPMVREGGKAVGKVSYNGRVWRKDGVEITVEA